MNYEPRDIRQILLVTGDELLTEVVGEDQSEIMIRNPLRVYKEKMLIGGRAREANFFTRWMSFADNVEFFLKKEHVLVDAIVDDQVADHYNRLTASIEHTDEVALADDEPEQDVEISMEDLKKDHTFH